MTTALDPRRMRPDMMQGVANVVQSSYDIELPHMEPWNDRPCPAHAELTAGCRRCGVKPRRHQRIGITWLYLTPRAGLFDSTGLGKTVQCAGLLSLLLGNGEIGTFAQHSRKGLIIARAATIAQWQAELARMVPDLITIAVTGTAAERGRKLARDEWEVALIGPEMLASKVAKGADQLSHHDIGTVICDDIDCLRNANKTSRTIKEICDKADRVVIATATPLDKKLTQLYDLGTILGWRSSLGSRQEFQHRYVNMERVYYTPKLKPTRCRWCKAFLVADHANKLWVDSKTKASGPCPARPTDAHFPLSRITPGPKFTEQEKGVNPERVAEFRQRIAPLVLRRTADQCDDIQMPGVIASQVWLTLGPEQALRYMELRKGVLTRMDQTGNKVSTTEAQAAFMRARQIVSGLATLDTGRTGESAKLDWVTEALSGDLSGEPVVVYNYFRPTLADLSARLTAAGIANVRIWGEQHASEQAHAIAAFNSGAANVILITDAGGMGLNLQKARRLVICDPPVSAGRQSQLIGRIKRDSSAHETVYVQQLLCEDAPVDKAMAEMLAGEAVMSAAVLDAGTLASEWDWADDPEWMMRAVAGA
jgi:SNF2 family DNA or RNA helicase